MVMPMKFTFDVIPLLKLKELQKPLKKRDGEWYSNIYHPMYFYPFKRLLEHYRRFISDLLSYNLDEYDDTKHSINYKAIYFSPEAFDLIRESIHPEFQDTYLPSFRFDLAFNECYVDVDHVLKGVEKGDK